MNYIINEDNNLFMNTFRNNLRNNFNQIFSNQNNHYNNLSNIEFINNVINNINTLNNDSIINNQEDIIVALTDDEFKKLETIDFKDLDKINQEENKCNICLDCFSEESKLLKLKCNHIFDHECIENWLKKHSNKCPICRIEIDKGHPINI